MRAIACLAVVLAPTIAVGQPAPASDAGAIGARVAADAAAGRAYFTDTALTGPRGSGTLGLRMAAGAAVETQVTYAVTGRIELGLSAMMVTDDHDAPAIVGFHGKGQLWRNDRAALAVGLDRYQDADGAAVTAPAVTASSCVDGAACVALVTASVRAVVITDDDILPVFAGVAWALGRRVQFVGEINYSNDDRAESLLIGYLGARAAWGQVAFDAGLGFAAESERTCTDCNAGGKVGPFLGVVGRI